MLQAQLKKSYRINQNHKRYSQVQTKGVLMHIDAPVYQQYKSIDLGATSKSHRIKHKSLSSSNSAGPQTYSKFKIKWENLLDRYIESKQKIQLKKGIIESSFDFLKLNKANRFRYIRLTKNQSLPLDMSRIGKMTQQIVVNRQKCIRRHKNDYETSIDGDQQIQVKNVEIYPTKRAKTKNIKERVLHQFIQNYFKNKHKNCFKEDNRGKHTIPQRNNYLTRSLMRNNTN